MKIKNMTFLVFLTLGTFAGCNDKDKVRDKIKDDMVMNTNTTDTTRDTEKEPVQTAPIFNLITSTDKQLNIIADKTGWQFKGFEGKVILLDFFGTWCPPCKAEIPHLNNIREKLKKDFEIIGVDIGPRGGGITPIYDLISFIDEFQIKYPVTTDGDNNKLYRTLKELNPNGSIPFMVLFNAKGEYVTHYIGMVAEEMLHSDIAKAIGK